MHVVPFKRRSMGMTWKQHKCLHNSMTGNAARSGGWWAEKRRHIVWIFAHLSAVKTAAFDHPPRFPLQIVSIAFLISAGENMGFAWVPGDWHECQVTSRCCHCVGDVTPNIHCLGVGFPPLARKSEGSSAPDGGLGTLLTPVVLKGVHKRVKALFPALVSLSSDGGRSAHRKQQNVPFFCFLFSSLSNTCDCFEY